MESVKYDEMVMDLLESALSRPRESRNAYLRATGNSAEIVAEVLDRADWEERMAGFLAIPLLGLASSEAMVVTLPRGYRIGHYRVQEELGRGGMGVVFKAVDENLGRTVALKILSDTVGSALDRRRFLREAKAASALNHPNIVAIHEFDSDGGQDFIAMEYIEGKTLDKAAPPGMTLEGRLGFARQIAVALARAHAAGIVHRDLKPGNIMVTKQGEVKVLDFGLAKHEHDTASAGESEETHTTDAITREGAVLGTPAYMSPEQVMGQHVDSRSDIFSFGVILYEMVSGVRPFLGGNGAAMLVQIAGKPHRPVRDVNPAVPAALAALIDRCLAKSPEDRLPSMEMVASEISAILAVPSERHTARRFAPWIVAAALAVAAGAAWFWHRQTPQPAPETQALPASVMHRVSYSLLNDQGIATAASDTFPSGSKVRFRVLPSSAGSLYLVNEGPGEKGLVRLYVLWPRPGVSAAVTAGKEILTGGLVFDDNPGIERVWVIWSDRPVPTIEKAVNGPLRGVVTQGEQVAEIQKLLGSLRVEGKTSQTASGNEVRLQSAENTLGTLIELRHQ